MPQGSRRMCGIGFSVDLAVESRRRIAAPFRDQRVRGFMARCREEKNDVGNEAEDENFGREIRHGGTVEVRAPVCKFRQTKKVLIECELRLACFGNARSSEVFSCAVSGRVSPRGRSPSASGPIDTRTKRSTSIPSDSNIRRICRFLPSSSTISIHEFFSPARSNDTRFACKTSPRFSTPRCQGLQQLIVCNRSDLNMIDLVEMRFGRRDARGPLRIVRHQQKSFACFVEAADGRDPFASRARAKMREGNRRPSRVPVRPTPSSRRHALC